MSLSIFPHNILLYLHFNSLCMLVFLLPDNSLLIVHYQQDINNGATKIFSYATISAMTNNLLFELNLNLKYQVSNLKDAFQSLDP